MAAAICPATGTAAEVECEEINPRRGICEVVFSEDPGERNALHVRVSEGQVTFRDRVSVRAGRMCIQLERRRARCAIGTEAVSVRLGRGEDLLRVTGVFQRGPELQADLGPGDDVFTGGPGSEVVDGGGGADRVLGGAGSDSLVGGAEDSGRNVLIGGPGDDILQGGSGADRLSGGQGLDAVLGEDGRDRINVRDGSIDQAFCGPDTTRLVVDSLDWISRSCPVRPRARAAAVPLGRDFPEADLDFKDHLYLVGCPADGPARCRGRVEVKYRRRLLLTGRFKARRGAQRLVRMREPPGFVRPDQSQRVLARVTVLSRDRAGRPAVRVARVPFLIDSEEGIE